MTVAFKKMHLNNRFFQECVLAWHFECPSIWIDTQLTLSSLEFITRLILDVATSTRVLINYTLMVLLWSEWKDETMPSCIGNSTHVASSSWLRSNREPETHLSTRPFGSSIAERQRFGFFDTWPCNSKQTHYLRFPIGLKLSTQRQKELLMAQQHERFYDP